MINTLMQSPLMQSYGEGQFGNPLLTLGASIMAAASRPGATLGGALGYGLLGGAQNIAGAQNQAMRAEAARLKLDEQQRKIESMDQLRQQLVAAGKPVFPGEFAGPPVTPTPEEVRAKQLGILEKHMMENSPGDYMNYLATVQKNQMGSSKYRDFLRAQAGGYTGDFMQYQRDIAGAGATRIVLPETHQENEFSKTVGRGRGQTFVDMAGQRQDISRRRIALGQLSTLLERGGSGLIPQLQLLAAGYGVSLGKGVDALQAAQALLHQMIPQQRPPGSGPMSDMDLIMYRSSLPRVINQPGGNKMIMDAAIRVLEYEDAIARIGEDVVDRRIDADEATNLMRELDNPLADYLRQVQQMDEAEAARPVRQSRSIATPPRSRTTEEEFNALW